MVQRTREAVAGCVLLASARFHSNKAIRACRQPLYAFNPRCLQTEKLHEELGLAGIAHSSGTPALQQRTKHLLEQVRAPCLSEGCLSSLECGILVEVHNDRCNARGPALQRKNVQTHRMLQLT